MSALPPKADIRPRDPDVCFGPKADMTLANFDVRFTPETVKQSRVMRWGQESLFARQDYSWRCRGMLMGTPRWGLLIAATSVGVSVFRLRMAITGHMAGIVIEARRIAANVTKLPDDDLDELAATSPLSVGFRARRARAARSYSLFDIQIHRRGPAISW
jgi:hypothetical protein